jgi:cobalt/nickel transport system permease protein
VKNSYVERTLNGILRLLRESIFAEEIAAKRGLLQSVDPRIRTISLAVLLGVTLFAKTLSMLGLIYVLVIGLALLSRISLAFFLERTWFFIPLFTMFVAIPAIFDFVTPGPVVFQMGFLHVTSTGLLGASFFVLRVADSVSIAILLSLTTRHFELLKVLRIFGVPQIFVMVTGMAYRYIYLLVEILENTHRAIKSRVGRAVSTHKGQRLVAWNMAGLWLRSQQLSEQVYGAMRSRGYHGEPVLLNHFKTRAWDWCFLAGMAVLAGLLIFSSVRGSL